MKAIVTCLLAGAAIFLGIGGLRAQTGQTQPNTQAYVQDGGARQTLESIFIPPMANAPFTCILHTEWAKPTGDGGTVTVVNQRKIARQSSGRFYQERWLLVPKNGQVQSQMSHIQIADPVEHILYNCAMSERSCAIVPYGGTTTKTYRPAEPPTGPMPDGLGSITNESLGTDVKFGVNAVGTRITRVFNAWTMGNDRPVTSTREFWFAPSLGITLVSKIENPHFGTQTFTVTDLTLGEPDAQLFDPPSGFGVQDRRAAQAAQ